MVEIKYCTRCGWLARSTWMAQELLASFGEDIEGVSLIPSDGGVFEVRVDGTLVWSRWSRAEMGGFPDIRQLKRAVRDIACPERGLGHTDSASED